VLLIPLIRFDDKIFNGTIKQEVIGDQVFNEIIKQENTDEIDHNNDRQLLQTGYESNFYHSVILYLVLLFLLLLIFF